MRNGHLESAVEHGALFLTAVWALSGGVRDAKK
jgi:hypothetical protein